MADNKDDVGKGTARPGEAPGVKRPYATLDLKATEVEDKTKPAPSADPKAAAGATAGARADSRPASGPRTGAAEEARAAKSRASGGSAGVAAVLANLRALAQSRPFLTHLAAGALGGLIVLLATLLVNLESPSPRITETSELVRRISDIEGTLGMHSGNAGLRGRVEELSRTVAALGSAQTRLEARAGDRTQVPQELTARIAKLEEALSAAAALPATSDGGEAAKAVLARVDRDLAAIRTDAGRLGQRVDTLRGEVDERLKGAAKASDVAPIAAKLAAIEQELQGILRSEAERNANAGRVVLSLELANLKRVMERGEAYASELARVKAAAGDKLDLTALERYALEGVPTAPELAKSYRKVANAMLDAEAEPADPGLIGRLLSGARSIVRVRKAGHSPDDASAEALAARMEAAIKEGRLADVLKEGKALPPKAALAAEDWLRKVEARYAVDQGLAGIEAALKSSLGGGRPAPAPDAKR